MSAQKTFILLGRTGDLINCLPLFQAEAEITGRPARVLCCEEYVPLLESASYVTPVAFIGGEKELRRAHASVVESGFEPVSVQVIGDTADLRDLTYGPAGQQHAVTDSFSKEPYTILKQQSLLAKQPRPVFDRRNKEREQKLIDSLPFNPRDCILVAAKGKSSPFIYTDILFELIQGRLGGLYKIIDLSTVQAEQFQDFLGILELARCLVTIDTAFLHLAHACETLPVCALVNDKPGMWFGSAWRANHISHIRYSDFPFRAVEMLDAMENLGLWGDWFSCGVPTYKKKLIHAWSGYEVTEESKPRHNYAAATWSEQYQQWPWVACHVPVGALGRDSKHHPRIKDDARLPFLKDVVRLACYRANEDDIIVLTRADTAFSDDISARLLGGTLPAYVHRRYRDDQGDTWHPMVDLFAFTKKWWQENNKEIPDFILGHDQYWNRVLLAKTQKAGAREIPSGVYRAPSTAKIPSGRRLVHNEKLHNEWQASNGDNSLAKAVVDQLPSVVINRHALEPHAYNPTIIQYKDRLLCCYRYHDQRDFSTALAVAEINLKGHVLRKIPFQVPHVGGSEEDARFFMRGDDLWLSYVDSTYPTMPPKAVVKYGRIVEEGATMKLVDVNQVCYADNDYDHCNKNWVFFEHKGELLCWYSTSPKSDLIKVEGASAIQVSLTDGPRWEYGQIRGGTSPMPYKGVLLRFFHSALDYEIDPYRRRYYIGAMTMDPEAPFKPIAISKRPILTGSELDNLSAMERSGVPHYKTKVVFPLGCVRADDGNFILSVGINDSHSALVTVSEASLNL